MWSGHRPERFVLQWHILERCNLHCAHCYQEGAGAEPSWEAMLHALSQFEDLLRRLRCGGAPLPAQITVTGGEPFLREDFFELLHVFAAKGRSFGFAVLTNGTLISPEAAERLGKLGPRFVQVSLDGMEETHDAIRGKGAFRRAVEGLQRLVRAGIRTMISFTASRGNFGEFAAVVRLGRKLGVGRVWADRLIPCGGGAAMPTLDPAETREFFDSMRRARDEADRAWFRPTEVAMHRALQFLAGGGKPYACAAGDSLLALLPNGDVTPCRRMPIVVGNVGNTDLAAIYAESDLCRTLRDRERQIVGCGGCFYRNLCRGGLKCLSYALSGDPFRRDPGCWFGPELLLPPSPPSDNPDPDGGAGAAPLA